MSLLRLILLVSLPALTSCGTVLDSIDIKGPRVFGGVRADVEVVDAAYGSPLPRPWWFHPLWGSWLVVGVPCSAVADLCILPWSGTRALLMDGDPQPATR